MFCPRANDVTFKMVNFRFFFSNMKAVLAVFQCSSSTCLTGSSTLVGVSSSLCWMPVIQTRLLKQRKWSPSTVRLNASGQTPSWPEFCRHTDLKQETTQTVCQQWRFSRSKKTQTHHRYVFKFPNCACYLNTCLKCEELNVIFGVNLWPLGATIDFFILCEMMWNWMSSSWIKSAFFWAEF